MFFFCSLCFESISRSLIFVSYGSEDDHCFPLRWFCLALSLAWVHFASRPFFSSVSSHSRVFVGKAIALFFVWSFQFWEDIRSSVFEVRAVVFRIFCGRFYLGKACFFFPPGATPSLKTQLVFPPVMASCVLQYGCLALFFPAGWCLLLPPLNVQIFFPSLLVPIKFFD